RLAPARLALERSASNISASVRSAPLRFAHFASITLRLAPLSLAPLKSARSSVPRNRLAFDRLAPLRLARSSLARCKLRSCKSRPARLHSTQSLIVPLTNASGSAASAAPVASANSAPAIDSRGAQRRNGAISWFLLNVCTIILPSYPQNRPGPMGLPRVPDCAVQCFSTAWRARPRSNRSPDERSESGYSGATYRDCALLRPSCRMSLRSSGLQNDFATASPAGPHRSTAAAPASACAGR